MQSKNPNFVFLGTSRLSVFVLEKLKENNFIPALIVTRVDKPVGRKQILTAPPVKIWAEENNVPFIQPKGFKKEIPKELLNNDWDVFVLASYGKIIPKTILEIPKRGVLNVHPSLLPKHRGATPIQSSIMGGDKITGVTIMLLDEEMDHGPIVAQKELSIEEKNYLDAEEILSKEGGQLLAEILPDWIDEKIKAEEQNHSQATYVNKFESSDGYIEPELVTKESSENEIDLALRKVRALNPEPGTYTILNTNKGELRVKIISAHKEENKFIPERVIPAGKKEMDWNDFLKGNPLS